MIVQIRPVHNQILSLGGNGAAARRPESMPPRQTHRPRVAE
jgi:hypothetical protein